MDESIKLQVRLDDNILIHIEGKGTIAIKAKTCTKRLIQDVYYSPGLSHNLLSVGQLLKHGFSCWFYHNTYEIENKKSGLPLIKIIMTRNNMFPLNVSCIDDCALVANVKDAFWL